MKNTNTDGLLKDYEDDVDVVRAYPMHTAGVDIRLHKCIKQKLGLNGDEVFIAVIDRDNGAILLVRSKDLIDKWKPYIMERKRKLCEATEKLPSQTSEG